MVSSYLREIAAGFRAAAPLRQPSIPRVRPLRCPACSANLIEERIHSITVDVSKAHGVWFDLGELEQFEARIQAGERLATSAAVSAARREGKFAGWWFGLFSLFLDDD